MKKLLFCLSLLAAFSITSCEREVIGEEREQGRSQSGDNLGDDYSRPGQFDECAGVSIARFENEAEFTKTIVEPLVISDDCDCIVSGVVKYTATDRSGTRASVDYGDGECDDWAIVKTCENGSCEDGGSGTCRVELDCEVL